MGVFDEGCMGMFNAIIPDELLHPTGVFKERLSQSTLCSPRCKRCRMPKLARCWIGFARKGMHFDIGHESKKPI